MLRLRKMIFATTCAASFSYPASAAFLIAAIIHSSSIKRLTFAAK